jgi:hypothetical protein
MVAICRVTLLCLVSIGALVPGGRSGFAETIAKPDPKKLVQGLYLHLHEAYAPGFEFSTDRPTVTSAAVAYIFLAGHRDEFQGRELSSPILRKSLRRVRGAQRPDGSFASSEAEAGHVFEATVSAILALRAAKNPDDQDAIRRALQWLEKVDVPDEDALAQFLKYLAIHGDEEVRGDPAPQLAAWSKSLSGSAEPETASLGLWAGALARRASESLGTQGAPLDRAAGWDDMARRAAERLRQSRESRNVLGACIAARTLHQVILARERK